MRLPCPIYVHSLVIVVSLAGQLIFLNSFHIEPQMRPDYYFSSFFHKKRSFFPLLFAIFASAFDSRWSGNKWRISSILLNAGWECSFNGWSWPAEFHCDFFRLFRMGWSKNLAATLKQSDPIRESTPFHPHSSQLTNTSSSIFSFANVRQQWHSQGDVQRGWR